MSFFIKIYTLNKTTDLYNLTPEMTTSLLANVYSVWVNVGATRIFAATNAGCQRLNWNGTNWILNTPT
jgi:hypothetical protein